MGSNRASRRRMAREDKGQRLNPPPETLQQAIQDAMLDEDRAVGSDEPINEWVCQNGIVLKMKRVPPTLLSDIGQRVPAPQPPQVVVDEIAGTTEDNPDDPDFKQALQDWAWERSETAYAASLIYGVEIKELPEGMQRPEDDEWIEAIERVNEVLTEVEQIHIRREPPGMRFFDWIKYYAVVDDQDMFAISRILTARVVLTEKEVNQMVAGFRRAAVEYPDLVGAITGWSAAYEDSVPAANPGVD